MKKLVMIFLAVLVVFSAVSLPVNNLEAKSKPWYGKYWEYKETAKKCVRFSGSKVILRGKWANTANNDGNAKGKTIKKTFKLTKNTKYYIDRTYLQKNPVIKVSKNKFEKKVYSDVTYCSFKVRNGKVVLAKIFIN